MFFFSKILNQESQNKYLIEVTLVSGGQEIFQINPDQFIKNLMREFSKQIELIYVTLVSKDNLKLYVFLKFLNQESPNKYLIEVTLVSDGQEIFQINPDQNIKNLMREFSKQRELIYVTLVSKDNLNFHVFLKQSESRIS